MTARTRLKRLVRARMARTGESYTAALRALRGQPKEGVPIMNIELRTNEVPEAGFALDTPLDWVYSPPDANDPSLVARFAPEVGGRVAAVFHHRRGLGNLSNRDVARMTLEVISEGGYGNFATEDVGLAGREGVLLTSERDDDGRLWAMRYYIARDSDEVWVLGLGTYDRVGDRALLDAVAASFRILADAQPVAERFDDHFAPAVAAVLARAQQLAAGMRHAHVGTEHLLVAMLGDHRAAAAGVLANNGLSYDALRDAVTAFPCREDMRPPERSGRVERVLAVSAERVARTHRHKYVGTDHILYAVLSDNRATATRLTERQGVDIAQVKAALESGWRSRDERSA
jgi:hypothetical protein